MKVLQMCVIKWITSPEILLYFELTTMYLISTWLLARRVWIPCSVINDFGLESQHLSLTGMMRKLSGLVTLGWDIAKVLIADGKIGTIRTWACWPRLATSHLLRKALAPMIPNLELTTAHWEWRDGENSVYSPEDWVRVPSWGSSPIWVRVPDCEVYCILGWRRLGSRFGKFVEDKLAYACRRATYAGWLGILSWVFWIRINVAPRLWRLVPLPLDGEWFSTRMFLKSKMNPERWNLRILLHESFLNKTTFENAFLQNSWSCSSLTLTTLRLHSCVFSCFL